jgi:hypothetical protein
MAWSQRVALFAARAIALCLCVTLLLAHVVVFAALVLLVAIVGTMIQTRRRSSKATLHVVTWAEALKHSSAVIPEVGLLDPDHPLIGLIVRGLGAGRYVNAVPLPNSGFSYLVGPHPRGEPEHLRGDIVIDTSSGSIRYLRQGPLADELWRRNFHSIRRGDAYRALRENGEERHPDRDNDSSVRS